MAFIQTLQGLATSFVRAAEIQYKTVNNEKVLGPFVARAQTALQQYQRVQTRIDSDFRVYSLPIIAAYTLLQADKEQLTHWNRNLAQAALMHSEQFKALQSSLQAATQELIQLMKTHPREFAVLRADDRNWLRDVLTVGVETYLEPVHELQRRYPPGSRADTMADGGFRHGTEVPFIQDSEIIRVLIGPKQSYWSINGSKYREDGLKYCQINGLKYGKTRSGKHILGQVGWRSCVATCAAMITMDHGLEPDWDWFLRSNLSNTSTLVLKLEREGFEVLYTKALSKDPSQAGTELENLIDERGSALVKIGGEIGNHEIIIDKVSVSAQSASIRDPWHAWAIEITLNAILKRGIDKLVQVRLKPQLAD